MPTIRNGLSRRWESDAPGKAGPPPILLYGLRHRAATLALDAGVDIRVRSEQLGHSTTTTLTRDHLPHREHHGIGHHTRSRRHDNRTGYRMSLSLPDQRADVVDSLSILAALRPHPPSSWLSLTEAVHWLVDDTFWDHRDPSDDVGTVLATSSDAHVIRAVLDRQPRVPPSSLSTRPSREVE